ncbi:HAD-IIIC family phosphatase [Falsiroseomonas sp. HC035]|uniref:HAD-IIIC family phosphatase n=1 Tax=Falsiroseomonas sp. HC035 TaxID=3390999 RepID=UPI003D3241D7
MDSIANIIEPGFAEIRTELRGQDPTQLDGAFCRGVHRRLRALRNAPDLRIGLLGNVTLDLLPPYVTTHCARDGFLVRTHVGGIGQEMQALLSPQLQDFAPDMLVLILSLRLLRPEAMAGFPALSDNQRRALRDEVLDHVEQWASLAAQRTRATLVVANFPAPAQPALGIADGKADFGEAEFHLDLNLELLRRMRRHARVQLLDIDRVAAGIGHAHAFDPRLFHLAKMDWSPAMMAAVGEALARHAVAARGAARKCLVLDLDNTLWGGVVGEEGPQGVLVGPGDATSEAFAAFQQRIRTLKQRGILLALCSKNNPADVEEVFALRPEMPLRREDFSAVAIGWNAKHEGLRAIAQELNIGVDSLVFIDDNPAEVTLVRELLPEVEAVLLPEDPSRFVATLDALHSFEKVVVLPDDIGKAEQYVQAAARTRLSATAASFEDYLAGLETRVSLRGARAADLARIAQLCTKTNQFNVSGKRHALGELEAMLASEAHEVICVSVADRFGDLGLVGVAVLREAEAALHVDTLLMSCRALGRGVETALMNAIKTRLLARPDAVQLIAPFVPTAKNHPAAGYFAEQGLVADDVASSGTITYRLPRNMARPVPCDWLQILGDEA